MWGPLIAVVKAVLYAVLGGVLGTVGGGIIGAVLGILTDNSPQAFADGAYFGAFVGAVTGLIISEPFESWSWPVRHRADPFPSELGAFEVMKQFAAEFFGTFALVFAGTGAITINDVSSGTVSHVGVALTFGLVVLAMIYAVGDVSGARAMRTQLFVLSLCVVAAAPLWGFSAGPEDSVVRVTASGKRSDIHSRNVG